MQISAANRRSQAFPADTHKWRAFATVSVGLYATVVGNSGAAVALPRIAEALDLDLAVASWVTLSLALTISAVLLPMGRLSDIAGRKRVYIAGLWVMAGGVLISATAQSLPILLVGRVVEGFGAAMVMTVAVAIVTFIFPPRERGKALGMNLFVVGLGAISGPAVGGALVDAFGWRAIFIAMAIVTLAGSLLALAVLDERRVSAPAGTGADRARLDWPGIFTSSAGLAILILALTNGNRLGWESPFIVAGFAGFVVLLAWFIRLESRSTSPMIDLQMFRVAQFTWASSARFLGFLVNGPTNFLMPFYLQEVTGRSAGVSGLITLPLPLSMAIAGLVSGHLSDRYGFRVFTVAGLSLQIGSMFIFSTFDQGTSLVVILPAMFIHGIGSGLWMAPNLSAAVGAVSRSAYGVASAFLNLVRNTANVTAVAIAAAVVAGIMISRGAGSDLDAVSGDPYGPAGSAFVDGMHAVFTGLIAVAGITIVAAVMAGRKPATVRRGTGFRGSRLEDEEERAARPVARAGDAE